MAALDLSDYGIIGTSETSALISRLGSIDWLCAPFLNSASQFGALLGSQGGGKFQIMPQGDFSSKQHYQSRSWVLETQFETAHGRAVLTDWMPERGVVMRRIHMLDGRISWLLNCAARFGYAEKITSAEKFAHGALFRASPFDANYPLSGMLETDVPIEVGTQSVGGRFTLDGGQFAHFRWSWGRRVPGKPFSAVEPTVEKWKTLAHRCAPEGCPFAGPWHDLIVRSSLILGILSSPDTGAIAHSITLSLSDAQDSRVAWLRDSLLAFSPLLRLGYEREARRLVGFAQDLLERDGIEGLQACYSLDGNRILPDYEITPLRPKEDQPARVSGKNGSKFQLEPYALIVDTAVQYFHAFGALPEGMWNQISEIIDYLCQAWRRPDHLPNRPELKAEHFVISKVLCWRAMTQALELAHLLSIKNISTRWESERNVLHQTICSQGYDEQRGTFVRSFGDRTLDSSHLKLPLLGFLPLDDPRILGTVHAIQERLVEGALVYRAEEDQYPDLEASFELVSYLAFSGRADEAADRLAEICSYATPLGFLGEHVNPRNQEPVGSFPSATAHLALISAAYQVGAARASRGLTREKAVSKRGKAKSA